MFKGLFGSRSQRRYARGIEQYNEGHLTDAIASFDEVIDGDDGGPDAALARFYRAEAHARLGAEALEQANHRQALEHFDAALAENDHFPDLHIQRAIALLALDDPLAAERAARAALELNPEFVDAGAMLVVALMAQGDSGRADDAAARWVRTAAEKGAPIAAAFTDPAGLFDALVAYRARRAERRRIVERAETSLRDGFWADAAASLAPLVEETPAYPDLRLRLAAALLGQGDLEGAWSNLEAALARNPDFADARVLAGIVALRRDAVRSARDHFAAAEAIGRVPLAAVYGQMLCDLRSGCFTAALDRMNRLAAEDAPPEEARVLHAILESAAGRTTAAFERMEAALVGTRAAHLLLDIGAWAIEQRELELAGRALAAVEEGERTSVDFVRCNVHLCLAEGALDRARQLCESSLVDHPGHAGLLVDLATVLERQGEIAAALRCLDQIGEPRQVLARLRARLLRQAGELSAARTLMEAPASDPADALELLYICRATDEAEAARRVWAEQAEIWGFGIRWRMQDPARWLGPLRPWPASASPARAET